MKEQHKKNLFRFFLIMDILVIVGLLSWLVAYGLTIYGLQMHVVSEVNPVMKKILFTKDELDFVVGSLFKLIIVAVGNAVVVRYYASLILDKLYLKYYRIDWPFLYLKKWYHILPILFLIGLCGWYLAFSVYLSLYGFIDMYHDIMVFKALYAMGVL